MFLQRSAVAVARRAAVAPVARRSFAVSALRRKVKDVEPQASVGQKMKAFEEIKSEDDLIGPGAAPGTVPTDLDQATGLERLELLGKMQGVDIFDMRPLDSSRKGTLDNPIPVKSFGDEQYAGCTGSPADSHTVTWLGVCLPSSPSFLFWPAELRRDVREAAVCLPAPLRYANSALLLFKMSRERPIERCPECGSVYKMEYIGPQDDGHGHHDHHGHEEPKTFADFVKPQYY
ncbi:COX5B-domain-containing protein [Xylaria sp. FL0064]|nr:COX5B-domain-containing protein [Xylaria sp. FL0064]